MIDKLIRTKVMAEILDVSEPQIYLMLRRGEIPAVRIGRLYRVREIDFENYIMNNLKQNNKNQTFCGNSKPGLNEMSYARKEQSHD